MTLKSFSARWEGFLITKNAGIYTIGARQGNYPGMAATEDFVVRLLQKDGSWKDMPVTYTGETKVLEL